MKPLTYQKRANLCHNPTSKKLLSLMEEKKTNLAFNPDVSHKHEFLELVDLVGPEICVLKTHIDIVQDFDWDFIKALQTLAAKHHFIIFEDRKFADIGSIVSNQYSGGIYRIAEWADIINAHILPGPAIIDALKTIGLPKNRGLLLLAEMSSSGNLAHGDYTKTAVEWANNHPDFVIGFICQQKLTENPTLLHLTPGVQRSVTEDHLGQKYNTPDRAIRERHSDIIIVGRGIYHAKDPKERAKLYREEGWEAYQKRLIT
jgi:uridine monophosphate synthetase